MFMWGFGQCFCKVLYLSTTLVDRSWGIGITNRTLFCQFLDKHMKCPEIAGDPPLLGQFSEGCWFRARSQGGQNSALGQEARPRGSQETAKKWGSANIGGRAGQVPSTQEPRNQVLPAGATERRGVAQASGRQARENRIRGGEQRQPSRSIRCYSHNVVLIRSA